MRKIYITDSRTFRDAYESFLLAKTAKGAVPKTIETYRYHFKVMTKYLDADMLLSSLTKEDLNRMFSEMRETDLSVNSIHSYSITMRAFLNWCREENLCSIPFTAFKGEDIIKETYTNEELKKLLQKPNMKKCTFAEYRGWVIVNFLMNSGCRAGTLRSILIEDVDLSNSMIIACHTKNRKTLTIPLCSDMCLILREYMKIRKGEGKDFLFCNDSGGEMTESSLRKSIANYNQRRGVQKTSIHLFRHTFAKIYLLECQGDAFSLQKLLGHSTLDMTKHYCAIFDADIAANYDNMSPLAKLKESGNKIKMKK